MVKGKIIYDHVIMTSDEWEKSVNKLSRDYSGLILPGLMDNPGLSEVHAHYFLIFSNNVKNIKSEIRNQVKRKLGTWNPIVLDVKLNSSENCEFYRIDSPRIVEIYRKPIFDIQSRWIKDKKLHTQGSKAISNLIEKLENGEY